MSRKLSEVLVNHYLFRLDPQGRCWLPADWRAILLPTPGARLVLLPEAEGYLVILSERAFRAERRAVRRQEKRGEPGKYGTRKELRAVRRSLDAAVYAELDARGRFKIPEAMRLMAGLDRQALLLGACDTAEIWSPHLFAAYMARESTCAELARIDRIMTAEIGTPGRDS